VDNKFDKAARQQQIKIQYVDLPNLSETFADAIDHVFFDGQTLRINFGVTRFDPQQPANARRYLVCRMVLTPGAAIELMNQIQQLTTKMAQAGVLKPNAPPPAEKKN
jgi:hypothetical protein